MKYFSYVVARDYGFAPNPFYGMCTLATCKPDIRKQAQIGDWIFGTGSSSQKQYGLLVYAMEVTKKITYNQYFCDAHYQFKKPTMHGSLICKYGDNIYYHNGSMWSQSDSHHSKEHGLINRHNLDRDTKSDNVLISEQNHFYYFGNKAIPIPQNMLKDVCKVGPGFRYVEPQIGDQLVTYLKNNYTAGIILGCPTNFLKFKRYDGK
jgi:hypothetical protein